MDIDHTPALEQPQAMPPPGGLPLDAALALANEAAISLGISWERALRDYLMHRLVDLVAREFPVGATIPATVDGAPVELPGWGFGGGTSLVSGHRLGWRYSDDIDLVLYMPEGFGREPRRRACGEFRDAIVELFTEAYPGCTATTAGQDYRSATITLAGTDFTVNFDVGPCFDNPESREIKAVTSLMGRYASPEQTRNCAGLVVPDVPPVPAAVTACNKLATLHGRATHDELDMVRRRGRDLYDLDALSRDTATCEAITEEIGRRVADGRDFPGALRVKWYAPRPASGYGSAAVFTGGTKQSAALVSGYEDVIAQGMILPGKPTPAAAEALRNTRGLDLQRIQR